MRHLTPALALCLTLTGPLLAQDDPFLELTASTAVRVVDAEGRPVPGASVWVGLYLCEVEQLGPDRFVVRTPPGQDPIPLGASAPGYLPVGREVAPGGQVTLTLDRGWGLRGRLVTPDGEPFPAGTVVELVSPGASRQLDVAVAPDGAFETFGLSQRLEALGLRVEGLAPRILGAQELGRERPVDLGRIELAAGRAIRFELRDDAGAAVPGWVELRWQQPQRYRVQTVFSWSAQADAHGQLVVRGLPADGLAWSAWGTQQRFAEQGAAPEGPDATCRVTLIRRVRARGQVQWLGRGAAPWIVEGQPEARVFATLTLGDAEGGQRRVQGVVGEGRILWEGLPVGVWTIQQLEVQGRPVLTERQRLEVEPPAGGEDLDLGTLRLGPG